MQYHLYVGRETKYKFYASMERMHRSPQNLRSSIIKYLTY